MKEDHEHTTRRKRKKKMMEKRGANGEAAEARLTWRAMLGKERRKEGTGGGLVGA
jgi:hypothetical protein